MTHSEWQADDLHRWLYVPPDSQADGAITQVSMCPAFDSHWYLTGQGERLQFQRRLPFGSELCVLMWLWKWQPLMQPVVVLVWLCIWYFHSAQRHMHILVLALLLAWTCKKLLQRSLCDLHVSRFGLAGLPLWDWNGLCRFNSWCLWLFRLKSLNHSDEWYFKYSKKVIAEIFCGQVCIIAEVTCSNTTLVSPALPQLILINREPPVSLSLLHPCVFRCCFYVRIVFWFMYVCLPSVTSLLPLAFYPFLFFLLFLTMISLCD